MLWIRNKCFGSEKKCSGFAADSQQNAQGPQQNVLDPNNCAGSATMYSGSSRLSAVEADGCQVSRPLRGLQWLYSDCLRAQHENVGGGPGTFIWTWAKRGGHGPRGEDLGGDDSVLSIPSTPGRANPSPSMTAALGPARARGENSKPGRTIRPKVNGGLTTGACWAPRRFTGIRELLHGTLDPSLGAYVGLGGGARTW
jgi:hypothetical protein